MDRRRNRHEIMVRMEEIGKRLEQSTRIVNQITSCYAPGTTQDKMTLEHQKVLSDIRIEAARDQELIEILEKKFYE